MDKINAIGARRGLAMIEDAVQSFGATYKGRKSCNLSTIGCTSFFPSKPLGCYGDGGALFTSDNALAKAMREIRVHGQSGRYHHTRIGVGGRMDTIQCAVLLAKLERFGWETEQRGMVGRCYDQMLQDVLPKASLLRVKDDRTSAYAQYTLSLSARDRVHEELRESNIPTAVRYPLPSHLQPAYRPLAPVHPLPVSEQTAKRVLCLPMYADLTQAIQTRISTKIGKAMRLA